MPWAPVFLSLGIGGYFALPVEPGGKALALAVALAIGLGAVALRGPDLLRVPALGLFLIAAGLLLGAGRARMVEEPVLGFRYYGPIEGRIVAIDRSFSDQIRLTLDRVVLQDTEPERTPARVRVALHGEEGGTEPHPGTTVILTGHLSPPEGPVEPGGFDFQRLAWFSGLGAVGYTRSPVLALAPPEGGLSMWIFRLRMTISSAMQSRIPGQAGAFAAALMTGDRSGVAQATNDALRGSNLSHLISISGLHMGLLTGFVFAACRYGMALIPPLALRFDTKKIAAVLALLAAGFYLMLAGPGVATRRAFIMAAVMLLAVLSDRRAISLRSVAIAAMIVLILEPESLIEPGFQMSFGATVALIVAFRPWARLQPRVPPLLRPVAMLVLSSMAAGMATAPIAAAHFNRIAEYGLLANLVAVPLMGTVVMPAGVIAAVLAPVGLAEPALWVMGQGTAIILAVARWITSLDGAVIAVPTPAPGVLALLALGGVAALIGEGRRLRIAGGVAVCLALGVWSGVERPALLVASDGTMAGIMGPDGRALSKPRGAGFVTKSWLEDDGDMAPQDLAYMRPGFSGEAGALTATIGGTPIGHYFGKGSALRAAGACHDGAILFLSEPWQGAKAVNCTVYDLEKLRQTGAVALILRHGNLTAIHARDTAGDRLWNRPARSRGKSRFGGQKFSMSGSARQGAPEP
ncbi:MAG: ComEC/Rec2 family competence protein [Rhodobacteraceae bacterium]|nr:ComEC/Rec2 family competence protein [Paracoccaceae bacterium]